MVADPFVGQHVGPYHIERKLGEGGMGAVYLARHVHLGREVALKILPAALVRDNPQFVDRFFTEARAAAMVEQRNIVRVYDADEVDGVHFIAMEFVRGMDLKELLATRTSLSEMEAVEIAVQAARGLAAAADRKIIHRDIKPANLMITEKGAVKVADFGLAKNLDAAIGLTQSGQVMGTPAYMSPEQAEGKKTDFHTDMYSLGVTLFELATGVKPYTAESTLGLLRMHAEAPVPDPLDRKADLNPHLARVITRMLAKSPAERFPSYEALIRDLDGIKGELEAAGHAKAPRGEGHLDTLSIYIEKTLMTRAVTSPPPALGEDAKTPATGARTRADDAAMTPATGKPAVPGGGRGRSFIPLLLGGGIMGVLAVVVVVLLATGVLGRLLVNPAGAEKARSRAEEMSRKWEEVSWVFRDKKPENIVRAGMTMENADAFFAGKKYGEAASAFTRAGNLLEEETRVGREKIGQVGGDLLKSGGELADRGEFDAALQAIRNFLKLTGVPEETAERLRSKAEAIERRKEESLLGILSRQVRAMAESGDFEEAFGRIEKFLASVRFEETRNEISALRKKITDRKEEEEKAVEIQAEAIELEKARRFDEAIARINSFLPAAKLEHTRRALSVLLIRVTSRKVLEEAEALLQAGNMSEALEAVNRFLESVREPALRRTVETLKRSIERDLEEEASITAADLVEPREEARKIVAKASWLAEEPGTGEYVRGIQEAWERAEKALDAKRLLLARRAFAGCVRKAKDLLALGPVIETCRAAAEEGAGARARSKAFSSFAGREWRLAEEAYVVAGKARREGRFEAARRSYESAKRAFGLHQEAILAFPVPKIQAVAASLARTDMAALRVLIPHQRPDILRRLLLEGAPKDSEKILASLPEPGASAFLSSLAPPEREGFVRKFPEGRATVLAFSYALHLSKFRVPLGDTDRFGNRVVRRNGAPVDPACGLPVEIRLEKPRIEFVLVPPGEFTMGSDPGEAGRYTDEGPPRTVKIGAPFYVGKYEVTQDQWESVMGENPSRFRGNRNPVDSVSWRDCLEFIGRLNASLRKALHVPLEFRLPSEAEMEYAVRAGTKTRFTAGDEDTHLARVAWFRSNAEGGTKEVGRKAPNAWGLYDAHGNVLEWCADAWHDGYTGAPEDGRVWEGDGGGRILRGGSFAYGPLHCRSACRFRGLPTSRENDRGLRLVLWSRPR